jgi:hypothetical protein
VVDVPHGPVTRSAPERRPTDVACGVPKLAFYLQIAGFASRAPSFGTPQGGTSKLVDRIERAGLIAREPDPDDRRASRLVLTTAGKRKLTAAVKTYEAEVGSILGGVLRPEEQQQMSDYVSRLLTSIDQREGT